MGVEVSIMTGKSNVHKWVEKMKCNYN